MDRREFIKALGEAKPTMELPRMPWSSMVSPLAQRKWLSTHVVVGHFTPTSLVHIRIVREGGNALQLLTRQCDMLVVDYDKSFRVWNLGNIAERIYPSDVLCWTMTDQYESFCIGTVTIRTQ